MNDIAERWNNVAQAAQWLAEGRKVQELVDGEWYDVGDAKLIGPLFEYRLKPEPPKPREFQIAWNPSLQRWDVVWYSLDSYVTSDRPMRVREVIE